MQREERIKSSANFCVDARPPKTPRSDFSLPRCLMSFCTLCAAPLGSQYYKCSGCNSAWYCSQHCGELHWKSGDHKNRCGILESNLYTGDGKQPDKIVEKLQTTLVGNDLDTTTQKPAAGLWRRPTIFLNDERVEQENIAFLENFLQRTMVAHNEITEAESSKMQTMHMIGASEFAEIYGKDKDLLELGNTRLFPNEWFVKVDQGQYLFLMVEIPSAAPIAGIVWQPIRPELRGRGTTMIEKSAHPEVFSFTQKEGTGIGRLLCPPLWTYEGAKQYAARLSLSERGVTPDRWLEKGSSIELVPQIEYRQSFDRLEVFPEMALADFEMREEDARQCRSRRRIGSGGKNPRESMNPETDPRGKAMRTNLGVGQPDVEMDDAEDASSESTDNARTVQKNRESRNSYLRTYKQGFTPVEGIPDQDSEVKFGGYKDARNAIVLLEIQYFEVSCAYRGSGYGTNILDAWRKLMLEDIFPNGYAFLFSLSWGPTIEFYEGRMKDELSFVSYEDFLTRPLERDYVTRGALLARLHQELWKQAAANRDGQIGRNYVMTSRWRRQEGLPLPDQYEIVPSIAKNSEAQERRVAAIETPEVVKGAPAFTPDAIRTDTRWNAGETILRLTEQIVERIIRGDYFLADVIQYAESRLFAASTESLFASVVRAVTKEAFSSKDSVYELARRDLKVVLRYTATQSWRKLRVGSYYKLKNSQSRVALELGEFLGIEDNATETQANDALRDYLDALESALLLAQIAKGGLYVQLDDALDNGGARMRHALSLQLKLQAVATTDDTGAASVRIVNDYTPTYIAQEFFRRISDELAVLISLVWPLGSNNSEEEPLLVFSSMYVELSKMPSAFNISTLRPALYVPFAYAELLGLERIGVIVPVMSRPTLDLLIERGDDNELQASKFARTLSMLHIYKTPDLRNISFRTYYEPLLAAVGLAISYHDQGTDAVLQTRM